MFRLGFSLPPIHGVLYRLPHCFRVFDHLLDIIIGQTARRLDANLLLFACAFVFCSTFTMPFASISMSPQSVVHRALVECPQVKLAEHFVVLRHFTFAL